MSAPSASRAPSVPGPPPEPPPCGCRRGERAPGPHLPAVREAGAGTVMAASIMAVLLVAAVGVAALIQTQAAAGRARAAADLAALGGATALTSVTAPDDPCGTAGRVARANGAELARCTVAGEDVTVETTVTAQVLGVQRTAVGRARAGPVDAPGAP